MAPLYARYVPPKLPVGASDDERTSAALKITAPLYSRYVPPKIGSSDLSPTTVKNETSNVQGLSKKRKRDPPNEEVSQPSKSSQKPAASRTSIDKISSSKNDGSSSVEPQKSIQKPVSSKQSVNGHKSKKVPVVDDHRFEEAGSNAVVEAEVIVRQDQLPPAKSDEKRKGKKKRERKQQELADGADVEEETQKHSSIFSKYQKSMLSGEVDRDQSQASAVIEEPPELHDLVPLPIPDQPPRPEPFSSFSALPPWIASPIRIPQSSTTPFANLHLDKTLVDQLLNRGFVNTLPVQTGVLPFLLPTKHQHNGDICVSAATGSGKTFAYVLPMVESLRKKKITKLRALIVVPTRELVAQVRETAELCTASTDVRIGTSVGSNSFDVERQQLIEVGRKYDPHGYRVILSKISRGEENEDDVLEEEFEPTLDANKSWSLLPDHVPEYRSKVDILICTPGRLVEHIKHTKGFSLADLEWFVIDEADRLLDQSFQEWISVVQKSITKKSSKVSEATTGNSFLARLVFSPRRHQVRKVVLSATMTRDLDKLASLKLRNPRMIIVEGSEALNENEADGPTSNKTKSSNLNLPLKLQEVAVSVDDGSLKPLYLLKVLQDMLGDVANAMEFSKGKIQQQKSASYYSPKSDSSDDTSSLSSDSDDSISDISSVVSSVSSKSSVSSSASEVTSSQTSASPPALPGRSPPPIQEITSSKPNALIFTSSNESAHRLYHIINHLSPHLGARTATLTKASTSTATRRTLRRFLSSRLVVLIATDRASRGLDLPDLSHVVNYDVPHSVTSYVHRVGRTARAGRDGKAWTLLADREAAWFWNAIARGKGEEKIGRGLGGVKRVRVDVQELGAEVREQYDEALARLKEDVVGGTT